MHSMTDARRKGTRREPNGNHRQDTEYYNSIASGSSSQSPSSTTAWRLSNLYQIYNMWKLSDTRPILKGPRHCTSPFPHRHRLIHVFASRSTDRAAERDAVQPQRWLCISVRIPIPTTPKERGEASASTAGSLSKPALGRMGSFLTQARGSVE